MRGGDLVEERAVVIQGSLQGTTDAVLFLPPAGSVESPYLSMGEYLPDTLPALHCEMPGRGRLAGQEEPGSVTAAVDRWLDDITALLPHGRRLHLFGHSLGALSAYELVIRLEAHPRYAVRSLSVSGAREPGHTPRTAVAAAFAALQHTTGQENDPDGTWLARDVRMRREHRVTHRPVHAPIALFCGTDDPFARSADMAPWASFTTGPLLGTFTFPGGHDYYLSSRAAVATVLTDLVDGRCDPLPASPPL
ncbi:thioesterase domain-containing protein [Streptomyces sp. NBC_01635]|uniref:thioesterase II family protein n=1 Tax=Streptomyces sp. NBC_01635 TaxID=2975904 RepID=UPI00386940FA|nr:thioesterase domain-containing protein [Streptomyces sp. NBC_01635]